MAKPLPSFGAGGWVFALPLPRLATGGWVFALPLPGFIHGGGVFALPLPSFGAYLLCLCIQRPVARNIMTMAGPMLYIFTCEISSTGIPTLTVDGTYFASKYWLHTFDVAHVPPVPPSSIMKVSFPRHCLEVIPAELISQVARHKLPTLKLGGQGGSGILCHPAEHCCPNEIIRA